MGVIMDLETFMRFPNGLEKALTFSYDDGPLSDPKIVSIFDKYNLLATFNLNSGIMDRAHGRLTKEEILSLYGNCRHEIAAHGYKHLFLTKINAARGIDEMAVDKKNLEQMFNKLVTGMAYAYGTFNEEIKHYLALLGLKYARTTLSTHSFAVPEDWLELNPTCHHNDAQLMDLADKFLNTYPHNNVKEREPYLFYVWGHSYEFDNDNNWHVLENFAAKVCNKQDVWYATNGQIVEYVTAFRNLQFSVDGTLAYNPSAVDVWLEQRGKTYCVPAGKTVHCAD